jgi:flagellar basal-body rod protein FlgB
LKNYCTRGGFSADTTGMVGKSPQIDLLARVLDVAGLRHAVIAHNLANVNTPGFRRLEVSFDDEMTRLSAGKLGAPKIVESSDGTARGDGNTVDTDVEVGHLNRNSVLTAAATQILALKLGQLRSAITGH